MLHHPNQRQTSRDGWTAYQLVLRAILARPVSKYTSGACCIKCYELICSQESYAFWEFYFKKCNIPQIFRILGYKSIRNILYNRPQEPVCFQMFNGRPAAPMDFSGSNCLLISTLRHGAPKSHAARAGVMDRVRQKWRDVREIRGPPLANGLYMFIVISENASRQNSLILTLSLVLPRAHARRGGIRGSTSVSLFPFHIQDWRDIRIRALIVSRNLVASSCQGYARWTEGRKGRWDLFIQDRGVSVVVLWHWARSWRVSFLCAVR